MSNPTYKELQKRVVDLEHRLHEYMVQQVWSIYRQNPIPALMVRKDGVIIEYNNAMAELTGYSSEDMPDIETWLHLLHTDGSNLYKVIIIKKKSQYRYIDEKKNESVIARKNGEQRYVEFSFCELIYDGKPTGLTVIQGVDKTEIKKFEEALKVNKHKLVERVKELICFYGISNLDEKPGISLEEIIQGTVELLPPAWQYPEITCARVVIDYKEYRTKRFRETIWMQAGDFFVHGNRYGCIEVFYLEKKPESDEGPFLKEERILLNAVAERLGQIIERRKVEEELKCARKELQVKTEKLKETSTAFTVLLKNQDIEKEKLEKNILKSLKTLVLPYLEKIKIAAPDEIQKTYVTIVETNLNKITNSFINNITEDFANLTPTEIQIAHLVKDNKTTKEIARILNISGNAVFFHRKNIRTKLGLKNKKTNLRIYLQFLANK